MRNVEDFLRELEQARKKADPGYGGQVFPAARVFSSIANDEELGAFKEAMARLLASADQAVRQWAVTVGSGFEHFRDAIKPPSYARPELPSSGAQEISDSDAREKDRRHFFDALTNFAGDQAGVDKAIRLQSQAGPGNEAIAFLDAIEGILSSPDDRLRRFGIDVCVEFVIRKPKDARIEPEGPTEFVVHSRTPFRLNRNFRLKARKPVAIHLPRAIMSPPGTPLSDIVLLSNKDATVGLLEPKPGEGVAAIVFELAPGEEICLTRSAEAIVDDGTENGVIVFDAQAA